MKPIVFQGKTSHLVLNTTGSPASSLGGIHIDCVRTAKLKVSSWKQANQIFAALSRQRINHSQRVETKVTRDRTTFVCILEIFYFYLFNLHFTKKKKIQLN